MSSVAYQKSDPYWRAAADFITSRFGPEDRMIAPAELAGCFPGDRCHCYESNYSGRYQWVALHKGMLRRVEIRGLMAACLALEPVFANEVFVIFADRKRFEKLDENNIHYESFLNVLDDEFVPECLERNGLDGNLALYGAAQNRPILYMGIILR